MNKIKSLLCVFWLAASSLLSVGVAATNLTGAGATFPYPIYAKWADTYKTQTGIALNYQSIGSGGGIKQIIAKTVDFGASDMPLEIKELDKNGLMQFPAVMCPEQLILQQLLIQLQVPMYPGLYLLLLLPVLSQHRHNQI